MGSNNNQPSLVDITPENSVSPVYLVQLTAEETAFMEEQEAETASRLAEISNQQLAKESALTKLAKLGLTEEEAKAVIGL